MTWSVKEEEEDTRDPLFPQLFFTRHSFSSLSIHSTDHSFWATELTEEIDWEKKRETRQTLVKTRNRSWLESMYHSNEIHTDCLRFYVGRNHRVYREEKIMQKWCKSLPEACQCSFSSIIDELSKEIDRDYQTCLSRDHDDDDNDRSVVCQSQWDASLSILSFPFIFFSSSILIFVHCIRFEVIEIIGIIKPEKGNV